MSPISARATAALLIIGSFIGGLVVGVGGDRVWLIRNGRLRPPRDMMQKMSERIVNHLDHELNLTPAQKSEITQIIDRHRARIDAIWAAVRPQTRQEIDATNAEIERVLTPDQRTKFRSLQMHMRQHGRHMGPGAQ